MAFYPQGGATTMTCLVTFTGIGTGSIFSNELFSRCIGFQLSLQGTGWPRNDTFLENMLAGSPLIKDTCKLKAMGILLIIIDKCVDNGFLFTLVF